MIKTLSRFILLSIIFTACNSKDKTPDKTRDKYEQTKQSLAETEKKNPALFITVNSDDWKNIIGQRVVRGNVVNSAKVCSYKDVDLELSFYSKTGALLEKDHEIIYETIAPGGITRFKTKYFAPKGTSKVGVKVMGAKTD